MTTDEEDEAKFLAAIKSDPDDEASRLVYADWLEERNDPRAEYLRLEVQLEKITPRIRDLVGTLDGAWLNEVTRKVDLVLIGARPNIIMTIRAIRTVTGFGLKEAKDMAEIADTRPIAIKEGITRYEAEQYAREFVDIQGIQLVIGSFAKISAAHTHTASPKK
jgi:uncharacterized protein (TIGR02996 family)